MARQITPELREAMETVHDLCAEVPSTTPGCRAWVNVRAVRSGEAISMFTVRQFEYPIEMMEREYDASPDELPRFERKRFHTEEEVNRYLDQILPPDANLIRVADDDDYPM